MTLGPYVKTVKYVEDDLYDFGVGFPYSLQYCTQQQFHIKDFLQKMQVHNVREKEDQPTPMNAFELISLSEGLNLENLFDVDQVFNFI